LSSSPDRCPAYKPGLWHACIRHDSTARGHWTRHRYLHAVPAAKTGTVPDSLPRLGPCSSPPFRQVPGDSTASGLHAVTSRRGLEIVPPRGLVPESSLQPAPAAGPTPAAGCSRRPESAARSSRRPRGCLHAHGSPAAMRSRSPPASTAGCTPAAAACGQVLLDESPATTTTPQPAAHRSVTAPPPWPASLSRRQQLPCGLAPTACAPRLAAVVAVTGSGPRPRAPLLAAPLRRSAGAQ
jgi:hypothetical protein